MSKNSASLINSHFEGMREFVRTIQRLGQRYSTWRVFEDFCAIAAISISNAVLPNKKREQDYLDIVKQYSSVELDMFAQMLADLVNSMEVQAQDAPADILGPVFHELELHNKWHGQFFTPVNVCEMMGEMAFHDGTNKVIEDRGFIEVGEPACGSGAMILGFAKALKNSGYNYCQHMVVTATDIDLKCVHMAYIQLSLYGIPAVVVHGNTITVEEWSRWYTPIYIMNGWDWRRNMRLYAPALTVPKSYENERRTAVAPTDTIPVAAIQYNVAKSGQLTLF